MDLAQLTDQPTLVEVAGRSFGFSELSLLAQGRLQAWIKNSVPHPLEAVKPYLVGLPVEVQIALAESARREAAQWPPQIGSQEAAKALLLSNAGQVQVLLEGLRVHKPDATVADAEWLHHAIKRDETLSRKIISLIFGTDLTEDDSGPKDQGANPSPSVTT